MELDISEDEQYISEETSEFSDYGVGKIIEADVLIDDDADRWAKEVVVKKKYRSINAFFKKNP